MTVSIATRLMIVNVSISTWEGRKLDRAVTQQTIRDQHVTDDDGLRVNKLLVSKESFKDVQYASYAVRAFMRERTLPWKDNGDRALMRQGYMAFMADFASLKSDWESAVENFISTLYPQEIARASFRLADAFNAEDYPHPEELRSRFKLTLDIDAVAEADDFRVKLDDDTVAEIQSGIREATERRIHAAMGDVWQRVASMVEHFAARTTPDTKRFHDTTVTNLQELVNLMPSLNLIGDPDLKALTARLKTSLCVYDPKELRKKPDVRAAAKAEADAIMEDMKSFMQALR